MQKNKIVSVVLGIVVIGAAGIAVLTQTRNNQTETKPEEKTVSSTISSTAQKQTTNNQQVNQYTLADVATHKDVLSCWTAINGNVYDLTSWISQHPGGESAILSICGKDGSDAFNNQHGGQAKPERMLQTFKIGALAP